MATFTINSEELLTESTNLSVINSSVINLAVGVNQGTVEVNWGDGTINSNTSHTYATPYTGDVTATIIGGTLSNITSIFSGNSGSSNFNFDLVKFLEFPNIEIINITRNFITGDLSNLNSLTSLASFSLQGNNTITGDISNLSNLTGFIIIRGNNTVFGNISNLTSLTGGNLSITGANTITGDITNNINVTDGVDIQGNNTLTGSIDSINNSVNTIIIKSTNNTVTSTLGNLPSSLLLLDMLGLGNSTGNINNISAINYTSINISSPNNTITGLIEDYVSGKNLFILNGSNLLGGDIGLITKTSFISLGFDSIDAQLSYTQGLWNNSNIINISLNISNNSFALSASELDQFIIDLDDSNFNKTASQSKLILTGGFTRTTASDIAFNQLIADGYNITIS